jgi:hypothetical protein
VALSAAFIAAGLWLMGLMSSGESARAQPPDPATGVAAPAFHDQRMERMRAEMVQSRLDDAAARLQIKASQEPAWKAFSAAVKTEMAPEPRVPAAQPNEPRDAATLLHRRATAELARAQDLTRLADAASKLQAVLDPNQQEVLDQIVSTQLRRQASRFRFGMGGPPEGGLPEHIRAMQPQVIGRQAMPDSEGPVMIIRRDGDGNAEFGPDAGPP